MLKKTLLLLLVAGKLNAQEIPPATVDNDADATELPAKKAPVGQKQSMYHMNYKTVVPIIAVGFAVTGYEFSVIYKKRSRR